MGVAKGVKNAFKNLWVIELQWMSTSCTIVPTFVTVYSCLTLPFREQVSLHVCILD